MRCELLASRFWAGFVIAAVVVGCVTEVGAQGEEGQRGKRIVTLTQAPKVTKAKGGGWLIAVRGKAPLAPAGTKVRLLLTWRSQTIAKFDIKTDASKKISEELKVKDAPISSYKMQFRTEVHSEDQSSAVKRAIKKDEETFEPALDPWTDYHLEQQFLLATPEEIEAELDWVRTFFTERYTTLGKIDKQVRDAAEKARAGEEYASGGKLDVGKWRKFMDKDVIEKIIVIQKEILESFTKPRLIPHRNTLSELREVANGVARRVTQESMDLYGHFEEKIVPADKKPEELLVRGRWRGRVPQQTYLANRVNKIKANLGIKSSKKPAKEATEKSTKEGA